ncbi:serine-rich adhesin for platelets [Anopheles bellator]|uniref:serine-rich adhesin for platelets n=1 Tax=Anopheles bellator TaxID=139047 RepID=UPI00264A2FAD|nr:serine-rich adhesin for platelets [Anopheles bellator]
MTSTAAPAMVASQLLQSTLAPRRPSVTVGRSVDASPTTSGASVLGASGGGGDGRLNRPRRESFLLAEANRTASLKTLSCDLSELLVKNLSLRRSATSERRPHGGDTLEELSACGGGVGSPPGNGGGGTTSKPHHNINNNNNGGRNSLCETFTSVNKLIKLKRVSSDGNSVSRPSTTLVTTVGGGRNCTKLVDQPSAAVRCKRVAISVRERTSNGAASDEATGDNSVTVRVNSPTSDAEEDEEYTGGPRVARKRVIVNQLNQVDENCPLLAAGNERETAVTFRTKDTSPLVLFNNSTGRKPSCVVAAGPSAENCAVPKVVLRRRVLPFGGELGELKRRSLQWPIGGGTQCSRAPIVEEPSADTAASVQRERRRDTSTKFRHSWNAPRYDTLEEDSEGGDCRKDFASIIHNLAGLRNHLVNGTHESVSLLEQHSPQIVPSKAARPTSLGSGQGRRGRPSSWMQSSSVALPSARTAPAVSDGGGGGGGAIGVGHTTESSPHAGSLGAPVPRKRRFEAFLKNLVGRRPSKETPPSVPAAAPFPPLLPSPEIKISKSPSEHNLAEFERSRLNISTTSLSSVHQKLWSVVPLLKRDVSCSSLASPKTTPLLLLDSQAAGHCGSGGVPGNQQAASGGLRKCETVLALTSSASQTLEPIRPLNRLRNCASVATCSRCSSLLSLAAAGSRYSLNASNGAFVPVVAPATAASDANFNSSHPAHPDGSRVRKKLDGPGSGSKRKHVGNLLRLMTSHSSSSSSSSSSEASSPCSPSSTSSSSSSSPNGSGSPGAASVSSKTIMFVASPPAGTTLLVPVPSLGSPTPAAAALTPTVKFTCKLCLGEFSAENLTRIAQCACSFCTECMTAYIEFEISEGAYEVSCPDAMCPAQGIITMAEISALASPSLVEKHHRYRLNREVELDRFRTWCPKAGCETICRVGGGSGATSNATQQTSSSSCTDRIVPLSPSSSSMPSPCAVHCHTCREDFCSGCKKAWHPMMSCEENSRRLAVDGQADVLGIPFDNDLIKCCPMCTVPIEKDEGCAQMMCKRCKHVFCWYCLASLDDDFLLRHYDKGPCKNKLGHSRASVVWHRAQVIGIFAGFGILLLVASPLLLLAAPCIVCCKCRICSGAAKLEETEVDYDDVAVALHSSSNPQR